MSVSVNENVRIRFSIGLFVVAVVHATLLAIAFTLMNCCEVRPQVEQPWRLPSYDRSSPSVSAIEKLQQPQHVNRQAQQELKQLGGQRCQPYCPPPVQPSYVQPSYVQPSYVQPTYVQPSYLQPNYVQPNYLQPSSAPNSVPAIVPSTSSPASTQPGKKNYQIALFVSNDAQSKQLLQWFDRDPQLAKLRNDCEFQVYTANNTLYRTRYSSLVPVDQFPVVLFQDSSGGHVHAAGRTMIPSTAAELYSDLRQGYELYKQAQQAQKTGALKTRGYSWDEAISPAMYLSLEDCPDGYCPAEPSDSWKPGNRIRDLLFDEVQDTRDALLWASAGELVTIGMIAVAVFLLGFILIKRGF